MSKDFFDEHFIFIHIGRDGNVAPADASGGDYPYYLDNGGTLSRTEWEAAGYPETPNQEG